MAEILDTATGTVAGDVAQIRTAIYGREVRASIAEAIELLDTDADTAADELAKHAEAIEQLNTAADTAADELAKHAEAIEQLNTAADTTADELAKHAEAIEQLNTAVDTTAGELAKHLKIGTPDENNIVCTEGFQPLFMTGSPSSNWMIYRFSDGSTTYDKIQADPTLAGTDITIDGVVYTYSSNTLMPGLLEYKSSYYDYLFTEEGYEFNQYGDRLVCGYDGTYSSIAATLTLYDTNGVKIAEDEDGDLEQCAILYSSSYGVNGFRMGDGTKVYLADLLSRIAALEEKIAALEGSES